MLDVFRFDPNFDENELLWEQIKKEILGDDDDEDEDGEDEEEGGNISDKKYVCIMHSFIFSYGSLCHKSPHEFDMLPIG